LYIYSYSYLRIIEWTCEQVAGKDPLLLVDGMILTCPRPEHQEPMHVHVHIPPSEEFTAFPEFALVETDHCEQITTTTGDKSLSIKKPL
jgi:hypothetical protein